MRVNFFNRDGSDKMVTDWHCGRNFGRMPLVQFETFEENGVPCVGDLQRRHIGHGCYTTYRCVAVDDKTVFLQEV